MWATRVLQRWPTCGSHMAVVWPTCGPHVADKRRICGRQLAHIHVAINRYINGNQEANAWHSTGTEIVHVWQLLWPTTGPHVAINRYRNGNQEMACSHGSEHGHRSGPYVAVVQAYKRPRCGLDLKVSSINLGNATNWTISIRTRCLKTYVSARRLRACDLSAPWLICH